MTWTQNNVIMDKKTLKNFFGFAFVVYLAQQFLDAGFDVILISVSKALVLSIGMTFVLWLLVSIKDKFGGVS